MHKLVITILLVILLIFVFVQKKQTKPHVIVTPTPTPVKEGCMSCPFSKSEGMDVVQSPGYANRAASTVSLTNTYGGHSNANILKNPTFGA